MSRHKKARLSTDEWSEAFGDLVNIDQRAPVASSRVAVILETDAGLYRRKAADYAPDPERPWENLEYASAFASAVCRGLADDDPRRATVILLGVKVSRLMTLGLAGHATNEPVNDTLADLRTYAAILQAMGETSG